jgi:uncharacterized SAM-binding protein YcdF (DUF218 family)
VKRVLVRSALVLGVVLILLIYPLSRLGAWLVRQDPLQKADVIFVLGGTRYERPLEGVDLYKEGWAPRIALVRQMSDAGELALTARGIPYRSEIDLQIEVLDRLGVPASALMVLDKADSTAQEADILLELVTRERWSRVIVVTSKQHTRRAGLVMRRRLAGTGAEVIVRFSRSDPSDVDRWWQNRGTMRFTIFESQRFFLYWIGVAD